MQKLGLTKLGGPVIACCFVLALLTIKYLSPVQVQILEASQKTIEDFDYTDLVFKNRDLSQALIDTNLVIINIDGANRSGIDSLLNKIASLEPKTIGVDILFDKKGDSIVDSKLSNTIKRIPNLILAKKIIESDPGQGGIFDLFTPNAAEKAYLLARLFEKGHFLADAWKYYKQAAELDKKYIKAAQKKFENYYSVIQ